ncbi:MAG TPA: hypothetical protein VNB90_03235 [Cytophagaceae bacterium]|jgi:hypothetical protein|nr:hypothetical protein [Cytophagaceae bacterium]
MSIIEIKNRLKTVLSFTKYLLNGICIWIMCLFVFACQNKTDKSDLISYLNDPDNGLKKEKTIGDYKIDITYYPTNLLIEKEIENGTTPEQLEIRRNEYERYNYFILNMSLSGKDVVYKGSTNTEQFSACINKLNFGLSDYIYALRDKKDTLNLADYYVPNLYGMRQSTQILFAFSKSEDNNYQELEITLKELGFGIGTQKFSFRKEDIKNIPSLAIIK